MHEKIIKDDEQWRAELPPMYTRLRVVRARSHHSRVSPGTSTARESIAASAAGCRCSTPRPSSTPAPAGRASTLRRMKENRDTQEDLQRGQGQDRSALRPLRRPPGTCFRGWPGADRPQILHRLCLADIRTERAGLKS